MADALASVYRTARRVRRWYLTLFFWALDTSLCNSFILYCMNHAKKPLATREKALSHLQYRTTIVDKLLEKASATAAREKEHAVGPVAECAVVHEKTPVYRTGNLPAEVFSHGRHLPEIDDMRARCHVCSMTTAVYCRDCDRHYCIVSTRNCFHDKHVLSMPAR
jgi:hypothetical protein